MCVCVRVVVCPCVFFGFGCVVVCLCAGCVGVFALLFWGVVCPACVSVCLGVFTWLRVRLACCACWLRRKFHFLWNSLGAGAAPPVTKQVLHEAHAGQT